MVLLVMGVAGSGKTTVGSVLAKKLGWPFLDADDLHSPANREKMHRGIPLTDEDRLPWLRLIHEELVGRTSKGENTVLACSALRQSYREILCTGLEVTIIYLRATAKQLHQHFAARSNHFVGENLVPSQLATLEEPPDALVEDLGPSPEEIVTNICSRLELC